jgi:mono/diheme cytochrome c family protein
MTRPKFRRLSGLAGLLAGLTLLAQVNGLQAQDQDIQGLIARGAKSYRVHCASCHGIDATGDGALAEYLKVPPGDLTQISLQNAGAFPFDQVYQAIDGREVPGHGTRAMPVWGPAFMGQTGETDKKVIREAVVELVYYLKSIQDPDFVPPPKMGGGS